MALNKLDYVYKQHKTLVTYFSNLHIAVMQSHLLSRAAQIYCVCWRLLAVFLSLSCQPGMEGF